MKTLFAVLALTVAVCVTESKAYATKSVLTTHDSLAAPIVDAKILGKFNKVYPGINRAMWQPTNEGYTASFKANGINTTWVYNKKHNLGYVIKSYDKSCLPDRLAQRIANAYEEYDIESAEEINVLGRTFYHVRIISNKFRKLIKMDENEIVATESMRRYNNP